MNIVKIMRKILLIASAAISAVLCQSCSKDPKAGPNEANKMFFDSWIQIYHPDARKEGLGIYLLEDKPGSGNALGSEDDYPFLYITYTSKDLDGNITETTDAKLAQQTGTYDESHYYGPKVLMRGQYMINAGMEMMLAPMKVGGERTAVIPGWFATTDRYSTEEGYLKKVTGNNAIYTITVNDAIKDIAKWQVDSIERYLAHNFMEKVDSVMYGYYYIRTQEPTDTTSIPKTETVKVNYTGQLLNGLVFDTSVKDTAKDAHLYSEGKSYSPLSVTLNEDYKEMDTVKGFSYCVSNMKKGEKGICIFYSPLGYEGSGSGDSIPGYSPLRFDIEMLGTDD